MQQNYDINVLRQEAQLRWLKPSEILFILQNHEKYTITSEPPQKPPSGSLFLFNRRVLRFFRKDGHSWRRKKDGRTVGEAHERLKVGNVDALNCYYAHGDQNPYFQRRSYWMLNPVYEHIVLVHYREVSEGRYTTGQNPNFNRAITNSNTSNETCNNLNSVGEVSSKIGTQNPKFEYSNSTSDSNSTDNNSARPELNQALRHLALQLSLEDYDDYIYLENKLPENTPPNDNSYDRGQNCTKENSVHYGLETKGSPSWKDMFELSSEPIGSNLTSNPNMKFFQNIQVLNSSSQYIEQNKPQVDETELRLQLSATRRFLLGSDSIDSPSNTNQTLMLSENQTLLSESNEWTKDISSSWFDQSQLSGGPHKQRFSISDVSPEWAFSSETTKVIITGHFLCDPLDPLAIMFGDIEVPVEIIQEGVLRCYTPPQIAPGKAALCMTSANRESCSEIRDFEFRENLILSKSDEEHSLLSKFAQLLLGKTKREEGNEEGIDWIVEELLREKFQSWLEKKYRDDNNDEDSVLTKEEQGIIHFVSGLGFEWALSQILDTGININFRDSNGWTALHWAAYFGREKMVAALLAKGASPTAVTDPNPQDPLGKTPGFLASALGHSGLAAYLSEVALTSHLSSLKIEEKEISCGSAVEDITQKTVSSQSGHDTEEEASLKDSLNAVRNSAQAAARIQAAFRSFSFGKRRQKSILKEDGVYGITQGDFNEISKIQNSSRHHKYEKDDKAACSIQKKYRGWKGRKNFLTFRQHVVKIQAHVRGHQVRKKYREFIWTVSVVEKAVLRWRRKGVGLRGFKADQSEKNAAKMTETPLEESEDEGEEEEDIAKLFRKQKVDNTLEEAVSRVLSMVDCPSARLQYRRMIERFREAKEEMSNTEATSRLKYEGEVNDAFMY